MKPPKALAWPALALCLAPVAAHAALIPAHLYRPARNMPHIVRPAVPKPTPVAAEPVR